MSKTATEMLRLDWPDLRRVRAQVLEHLVMSIIDRHICDHGEDDPRREIADKLFEELYNGGYEIISDYERERLGMPPRGEEGWTAEELIVLEKRRLDDLMKPHAPLLIAVCPKCGKTHDAAPPFPKRETT